LHNKITASTVAIHKTNLDLHILPYFEKMILNEITADNIEGWLMVLKNKEAKNSGDKLKNNTVNLVYRTLRLMMGEAVRRGLITVNPTATVKDLENDDRDIEILKLDEVRLLFPLRWESVWDNFVVYKANKLAAYTGMRIGELLGLRGEYVFDDYVRVCGQYSTKYGFTETKTKKNRDIPITKVIRADLGELIKLNKDGYLFSEDGGGCVLYGVVSGGGFDTAA
jgi:integrase